MFKNFKNRHTGFHLEELAWTAASAYTQGEFKKFMRELEKASPAAKAYLDEEVYPSWARSYFEWSSKLHPRY
ncbi:hypothetical protein BVC80_8449g6 [Macleaya cordata]|uniref:Uncharacterized protein n=1 Tax=Macleaya cordata TaxID=56857 RepID=A0A200PLH7_MACCD|nr:hypothetical protein BVC80_8449g6 [Macleaya cordata]